MYGFCHNFFGNTVSRVYLFLDIIVFLYARIISWYMLLYKKLIGVPPMFIAIIIINLVNLFNNKFLIAGHTSPDKLNSYFSSYSGQKLRNAEDIQSVAKHQKAPIISFSRSGFTEDNMPADNCDVCSCLAFFEWLGCVACGIDW